LLSKLSIENYALIDTLQVNLSTGFTVITGETGAGKSILLGGLSLVLGKRADLTSLRNKEQKCIIEAEFTINEYGLKGFFTTHDLDYEERTIIRREILPSGKSRAFINDTPVTLQVLSSLGSQLIDIHSQHQTQQATENDFQFKLLDALAKNKGDLEVYTQSLQQFKKIEKELNTLLDFQKNAMKEQDYNTFLLSELEAAPLKEGIVEELEGSYEQLNNVEVILEELSKGAQLLGADDLGVLSVISEVKSSFSKLQNFGTTYKVLQERIQSVTIELEDVFEELQAAQEGLEPNPKLLEETSAKLQLIYSLQKKHGVSTITELTTIKNKLADSVFETANITNAIDAKQKSMSLLSSTLQKQSINLRAKRNKIISDLKKQLEANLGLLGMPNASFKISLIPTTEFKENGMDVLLFLFTANKGSDYGLLKKVASGGELSRIMLVIKAILSKYENLPTIMFDEIDTGVSGEISNKMADIMKEMSKKMQVFSITHLPQVASKGHQHFKVFKKDTPEGTKTNMKFLATEERIDEIAHMLGGKDLSAAALAHAKELLS